MEQTEILSIIANELSGSEQFFDYQRPLDYYLGNPDGREVEGRSSVISTDVADAIEWIMPQVMKSFTQNNEIVVFDPISPEDELQADLESQFTYDVLMKDNDGFIIIHQFVKDALMQNNGIIKVFYDSETNAVVEEYTGLTQEHVVAVAQIPNSEILEFEPQEDGSIKVKIVIQTTKGKVTVESVPPEQFRVNSDHNSINLDKASFTAHVFRKTVSDLIKDGFDPALIESIGADSGYNTSDYRFAAQNESVVFDNTSLDPSMRLLDIAECYMQIDVNGDGIAEYCKITVAGVDNPSHVLSIEEMPYSPWISTTGILMSHKFRGLSIYDRLVQIQDQKTALMRNTLDNIYLQNNQRNIVVEGQVNLDDVLLSRPGGVIRAKRTDAIVPLVTPSVGQDTFTMLQYLDSVRAGRVGVAPEGEVTPQRIGERVGSEGVSQLLTAKEELVGLIVRVIAETGIKPLCVKIRDICVRHIDAVQNYKLRGAWLQTNPATWADRNRTTVRVGTGTGNRQKQIATLGQLMQIQGTIQQIPGQTLVNPAKVYAALDDFCKFSELLGASKYFVDPTSQEGQMAAQQAAQQAQIEQQKQEQANMALLQAQVQLSQAELQKAQAQQDNVALKGQIEQLKSQLENAKNLADATGADADRQLKKYEIDTKAAIELTKIETTAKTQEEANAVANREAMNG